MSLRVLHCLLASWLVAALACAPKGDNAKAPPERLAAPPAAEVAARLTEVGPIGPDDRLGHPSIAEPQLVDVGPHGAAPAYANVTLRFSEAMDATGPLPTVALDPPVEGELRWTDAYRLTFVPDDPLPEAHEYTVVVSGNARSRGGVTVPLHARWSFETDRPTVSVSTESYDGDDLEPEPVHWRNRFAVRASHHVGAAKLRRVTEVFDVTGDKPRKLPFGLEGTFENRGDRTTRNWEVVPRGHWPADATIEVRVREGLVTRAGPLPTDEAVVRRLRTRKGLTAKVECEGRLLEGCPPGYLTLDFDTPVPRSHLRHVRVTPKPKNLSLSHGYGRGTTMNYVFISGDFEPGTTYRVRIKKGLTDIHGQPYAGPSAQKVPVVRPPPLLELSGDAVLLASDKGTLGLESRLVEEADLSISTLDDGALAELLALEHDARYRPRRGVQTHHQTLDLVPGGTYGWDARELDLSKVLGQEHFAAFVEVEPNALATAAKGRSPVGSSQMLVQRTDLGAVFGRSPARSFVRVASLSTAAPLAGAYVTVFDVTPGSPTPATEKGTFGPTDPDGFVLLPEHGSLPKTAALVIRRNTDRFAMLVPDSYWYHRGGKKRGEDYDVGVLMPDRNLYQPGERMRVMGWVAKSVANGGAGLASPGRRRVKVELESQGKVIAETTVRAKAYGKFWATLDLPEDTPLGRVVVRATLGEGDSATGFTTLVAVREFEAPAFDVKLSTPSADVTHNSTVAVSARAAYLHGMPLPIERARLASQCRGGEYEPPGAPRHFALEPVAPPKSWSDATTLVSTNDHKRGVVETRVDLSPLRDGHTYRCSLSLGIQDIARQEISTETELWVHPSHYLLLSSLPSSSIARGTAATWTGFSVLFDGATGPAETAKIEFDALEYDAEGHLVSSTLAKTCTLEMRDEAGGRCSWTPRKAGSYRARITATVDGVQFARTDAFRVNDPPVRRRRSAERIHFTVEAPSQVEPGDAVAVNVLSPDETSSGFVVDVHAGVRSLHAFELRDHTGTVSLRADDAWVPRTYLDTFVTRPNIEAGPLPRVLRTTNRVDMGVAHRALTVKITNPATASIRSTLPIEVRVADALGNDVADAHVSVWAVDEGVLMLREWRFPDFPSALMTDRGNEATYVEDYSSLRRPYDKRRDPYEPDYGSIGLGGTGMGRGGRAPRVRRGRATVAGGSAVVRRNFDPAPIFVGDVVTDASGVARLRGKLPDNLTTFRIAAVATAEVAETGAFARAGRAEGRVRVTQDLGVRALLPNVLRPGDTAELAALVDNIAGVRGNLTVEVEIDDPAGALELLTAARVTRRRTDAPQERVPYSVVARKPGTVQIRVLATLDAKGRSLQDASELTLEVVAERTLRQHSATYGSLDTATPRAVDLAPPEDAHNFTASVDLYTSLLGGYANNVDALLTYPYGCVEQTSSQLVPVIALHALADYPLGIDDTTAFVEAGVQRLADMQLPSGGFGYWPGASTPHVYGTAYAAWVLGLAQRSGYDVSPYVLDRAAGFLEEQLVNYGARGTPTLHQEVRAAMALQALAEADRSMPEVREALIARAATLPAFARALLVLAVHRERPDDPRIATLLTSLTDNVEERDSIARSRAEPTRYSRYFDTPVRTDAMLLLALAQIEPESPLVEKLARGLSRARDEGSIRNTQENAYVLLAMAAYARLREATAPALDVHTWLDSDPLLDVRFDGRDLGVHRTTAGFGAGGTHRVTLDPQGEGRLYYRVGMGWTKSAKDTTAQAAGLAVTRRLHDAGGDYGLERPLPVGDTAWLEVHVTADMRQRYVALDIPIPAGLEAVDTSLGRTGSALMPGGTTRGARGLPYSHKELRRDRILVFVDQLDSGDHRITVPVRATHEGTYAFPPARAEAMYSPEVYGHSAGETLVVGPARP